MHVNFRFRWLSAGAAILASTLMVAPAAVASDDSIVPEEMQTIEVLNTLRVQLKAIFTHEAGFPEASVRHWNAAVDVAFAQDLLEADLIEARSRLVSDDAHEAAVAFERSPLGQKVFELAIKTQPYQQGSGYRADAQRYLNTATVKENSRLVDLFEMQSGPERANAVMDVYYRAMKIAAEPAVGAEAAGRWAAGAEQLRAGYVEDYFLAAVAIYNQLPEAQLEELSRTLATASMVDYAEQETAALAQALEAAVDRLEAAYGNEVEGD